MADIIIDIASEFTGAKAFKQADKATDNLMKNVKKLAKTLGVAYGSQQILAFGKASIKAAAADQKAQQQLALALKNVGLGRDAASSEAYIQRLQSEFGIVDDLLRPAYQTLAVATRDSSEAQRLLNLSLDIAASTGKDLGSVTAALSKAYLGNNTALSKLGVGISKADLKAKSFSDITNELTKTFAGSATAAANTFQGSIDKLGVASANVKEIIGTGLIDALTGLGKDSSIADLASNMEKTATYLADVIRGVGVLAGELKKIPVLGNLNVGMIPIVGSYIELLRKAGTQTGALTAADNAHLKSLQDSFKVTTKTVANNQTLAKLSAQQIKDLKLKAALEKANLALGRGGNIFDMDAIQLNAALLNQAQQLGNVTNSAQLLAITNDIARLKVKQDILNLEAAIASGDQKAIEAATAKLNADLAILGTLQQQNVKLLDIKSILDTLLPKDLINLQNLKDAIALLGQIATMPLTNSSGVGGGGGGGGAAAPSIAGLVPATTIAETNANVASLGGLISTIGSNLVETTLLPAVITTLQPNGKELNSSFAPNITINTGIGDPNAIAEAITQVIQDAVDRGTLRGGAY